MVEVGIVDHRGHGGVDVLPFELGRHVLVEHGADIVPVRQG
ncbi:MAG TPA: hypothetical protein VK304_06170 [Thermoleophilaceae bacterium]|nr:hypothetical protein [Thermoleophilaceae bacterium]